MGREKPCGLLKSNDTKHLRSQNISFYPDSVPAHKSVPALPIPDLQIDDDSKFVACVCLLLLLQASSVYAWLCLATSVFASICPCVRLRNSPGHHYEEVQAVPCVSKVTLLAKDPQGHHLDHHLNGKECEDEVIEVLQNKAEGGRKTSIIVDKAQLRGVRWCGHILRYSEIFYWSITWQKMAKLGVPEKKKSWRKSQQCWFKTNPLCCKFDGI